jgi:hypothetical protein
MRWPKNKGLTLLLRPSLAALMAHGGVSSIKNITIGCILEK